MPHILSLNEISLQDVWLTIGAFDGVHRGHQEIIKLLIEGSQNDGVQSVVLTFHPHPSYILRGRSGPYYLTSPEEKALLLVELGVDFVVTQPFTKHTAITSARQFMEHVVHKLHPKHLLIGHDFALGRERQGNGAELQLIGEKLGYKLSVMEPIKNDTEIISSSRIRQALAMGDVSSAERMLGRPFYITGRVIPGDGRGKTLGIPTANLAIWKERAIPKSGVYACRATVSDKTFNAVVNIGFRPTFDNTATSQHVEAHILNFNDHIYGDIVRLDFIQKIRDEKRFPGVEALIDQIHQDIEVTQSILQDK